MSTEFYLIAAALVTLLSAARLTRLAVADDFPPVKFFRDRAYDWLDKGPKRRQWQILTWCAYCASFWLTLLVVLWGYFAGVYGDAPDDLTGWALAWWIFNGSLGAAYVASIIVRFDGDDNGDDDITADREGDS